MGQLLLLLVVALTVGGVVFGVTVLVSGGDQGMAPVEPDARAIPLPGSRPLLEGDVSEVRFDTAVRGYRMAQVDQAMRRAAYDIGYKDELIGVLEAEVIALREGRAADADVLRRAREAALGAATGVDPGAGSATQDSPAGGNSGPVLMKPAGSAGAALSAESGSVAVLDRPADGATADESPTTGDPANAGDPTRAAGPASTDSPHVETAKAGATTVEASEAAVREPAGAEAGQAGEGAVAASVEAGPQKADAARPAEPGDAGGAGRDPK